MNSAWILVHALCVLCITADPENLLRNPNFEEGIRNEWKCPGCSLHRINQSYEGRFAAKVSGRGTERNGLQQFVRNVKPKTNHAVGARIRLLNLNHSDEYYYIRIDTDCAGENDSELNQVAAIYDVRQNEGWIHIDGDFQTLEDTRNMTITFLSPSDQEIEFYVDATYLYEIPHDPNWREKANKNIQKNRKGNLIVELKTNRVCSGVQPNNTVIQIKQKKADFPFGSAMQETYLNCPGYTEYFYSLFNWATPVNSLKWRMTEEKQGHVNFTAADILINSLTQNGISIRGHCISWDKEEKIMDWLSSMTSPEIMENIKRRVNYIIKRFFGRVHQWDVNNEIITQLWYEKNTGNPQFTQSMMETAHKADPNATLFLNEYGILNNGKSSSNYLRKVGAFKSNDVPLHALGIQSHIGLPGSFFDLDLYKRRLDKVGSLGLPIWITEFDLELENVTARALQVEDALRLFFSHPAVEGIMLWGFWSETNHLGPRHASLVDGKNLVENAVGKAVRRLYKTEWWTNERRELDELPRSQLQLFRVFHGNHTMTVSRGGRVIWSGDVRVVKGQDQRVVIDIDCLNHSGNKHKQRVY